MGHRPTVYLAKQRPVSILTPICNNKPHQPYYDWYRQHDCTTNKGMGRRAICQNRDKPFINGPGYLLYMITIVPKTDLSE